MEESTGAKRSREDNETEGSSVKKIKPESNEENTCDYAEDSRQNHQQKSEIIRKREEANFLRLFTDVSKTIIAIKDIKDEKIDESISLIKSTFIKGEESISFSDVDLTKWENVCGYLYRYGPQGAGLARFRILNALQNCTKLKKGLEKQNLKIICFGAGPGNDALGLCSILPKQPKNLKLSLVDRFKEWRLCIKLAKTFIEEDNFGKISKLFQNSNVKISFIQAELAGELRSDRNYFHDLEEADIIVICRLFTNINKSEKNIRKYTFTKILKENMKEDAIILLIDTFFDDNWEDFHRIYHWGDKEEDRYVPSCADGDVVESILPISVIVKQTK